MIEEIDEITQHTRYWYTISEVAKMLNLKDKEGKCVGRNKMFRVLRYNKVLMADSNQPFQYFLVLGHIKLHSTSKRWKQYFIPVFSDMGVNYLKNKFESGDFIVNTDWENKSETLDINDVC